MSAPDEVGIEPADVCHLFVDEAGAPEIFNAKVGRDPRSGIFSDESRRW